MIDKFRDVDDADLQIQCDVFCDEKHDDEEELGTEAECPDLSSHSDLFNAIYDRVRWTLYDTSIFSRPLHCKLSAQARFYFGAGGNRPELRPFPPNVT